MLAAGIVAVNSGNNLLYFVVAVLLALFGLSGLLGHRNLSGVRLRLLPPEEAWAGRPVSVRARLAAAPGPLVLPARRPDRRGSGRGNGRRGPAGRRRGGRPRPELRRARPAALAAARGLLRVPLRADPPRARRHARRAVCLVYPQPLAVDWERVDRAEREGELAARREAGHGGDFRGLREYAPGDSISRVQWTSWLRLRRLQTKEFETEGAPPVVYAFDAVPGPGTEERLGQLAWLVRTALRRGRAAGLELPGLHDPAGKRRRAPSRAARRAGALRGARP